MMNVGHEVCNQLNCQQDRRLLWLADIFKDNITRKLREIWGVLRIICKN